jgi:hypothetical protein
MPDLSLGGLRAVLDLGKELGLDPDALVRDPFRIGLRLADKRLQTLPQVRGRDLVEAVVDLAGVDEIVALAPADVEPVSLGAVQRESGDGQRFPLRAGLLDPVVASAGRVGAVPDLRHDSFQADLACFR